MALTKAVGNMYDWVTHMHTHLGGECGHRCRYCYIGTGRFGRPARYTGEPRILEDEFKVKYGSGKVIFIEHKNDLFAENIPESWIIRVMDHCKAYPGNQYVFQSKNPARAVEFINDFPSGSMMGTTIETDLVIPGVSEAPHPETRAAGIKEFKARGFKTFITIEPIMDFTDNLAKMIVDAKPDFVNIGADSKRTGLQEPTKEQIMRLVEVLNSKGIVIRKKVNLERILK